MDINCIMLNFAQQTQVMLPIVGSFHSFVSVRFGSCRVVSRQTSAAAAAAVAFFFSLLCVTGSVNTMMIYYV